MRKHDCELIQGYFFSRPLPAEELATFVNVTNKVLKPANLHYTVGIPELKLPTIEVDYDFIRDWSARTINTETGEEELENIPIGALIVVDEAWRVWKASGAGKGVADNIEYLAMHRHHGLDFLVIAQMPSLIHKDVLAMVSKHLHILPHWSGRKLLEWPEYVSNPRAESNRSAAVTTRYKLPVESFGLYKSASEHTKIKRKLPPQLLFVLLLFLSLPFLIYFAYSSVFAKNIVIDEEVDIYAENLDDNSVLLETPIDEVQLEQPVIETQSFTDIQLVSRSIDWSLVNSCVASETQCICYGHAVESLVVPDASCRAAVMYGWPGKKRELVSESVLSL